MPEEDLDEDGYPTTKALEKIAKWSFEDPLGLFEFIELLWSYSLTHWRREESISELNRNPIYLYYVSTAGWSGNESIIKALNSNFLMWHFHWVQSRRGGHYIFEVKKPNNPRFDQEIEDV